jgi:hypothetical protein
MAGPLFKTEGKALQSALPPDGAQGVVRFPKGFSRFVSWLLVTRSPLRF